MRETNTTDPAKAPSVAHPERGRVPLAYRITNQDGSIRKAGHIVCARRVSAVVTDKVDWSTPL